MSGVLSWFASSQPDGLEWSLAHAAEGEVLPPSSPGLHTRLAALQQRTAWLPGYGWPAAEPGTAPATAADAAAATPEAAVWPEVDATTSLAGVAGGALTLVLVTAIALGLRRRRARA